MNVIYDALVAAPSGLTRTAISKTLCGNVPSNRINEAVATLQRYGAVRRENRRFKQSGWSSA